MEIIAGEYKLRTFNIGDVISFFDMTQDEEIKKYVPYVYQNDIVEATENVLDYIKGDMKNDFYLLIEKERKLIGMIIAVKINNNVLEVSAFVAKEFRGKGIMTIVMNSFINYLKQNTDYEKLMMIIDKENIASNSQIKKIGGNFIKECQNNNVYVVLLK